jgi:SRSO17 transposase
VLDRHAWALLRRLTRWLDQFKDCFGHRAQHVSLRQYIDGLLGDSARKSMSAMLARVSEPTSYQAFQHFITHAPWDAERVWKQLRAVTPARTGILILDETSFPKAGTHSVGVARQYCGAVGKVANCQVAVTAALWAGQQTWPMGAALYLPEAWTSDPARREAARVPAAVRFQEKWRMALTLLRRTRAAGITLTAVVADAEYGDNSTLRRTLHHLRLPYALGISPTLTVYRGTPTLRVDPAQPRPRNRRGGWPDRDPVAVRTLSDTLVPRDWQRVAWRPRCGCSANAASGPRDVGVTTWCSSPRRPRSRSSCAWRISAGRSSSTIRTSRPSSASIISRAGRIPAGSITWRSARSPTRFSRPSGGVPARDHA